VLCLWKEHADELVTLDERNDKARLGLVLTQLGQKVFAADEELRQSRCVT